jgi:hypothetical protein
MHEIRRRTVLILALLLLGFSTRQAAATNHIIYLHGRSMLAFPVEARIPAAALPAGWDQINPTYDGNKRLGDATANGAIKDATAWSRCGRRAATSITSATRAAATAA